MILMIIVIMLIIIIINRIMIIIIDVMLWALPPKDCHEIPESTLIEVALDMPNMKSNIHNYNNKIITNTPKHK